MKNVIIATKNKGKAKEFKAFFSKYKVNALSLLDLNEVLPNVEETGTTFHENAAIKAEEISLILDQAVLADDSGLAIDALNGRPGIYSARYAGTNKNDLANMKKVLEELKDFPIAKRGAQFICVLAIAMPGKETIFKKGVCEGYIGFEMSGKNGFGYDPIFIPTGHNKTMAEITALEKSTISHRGQAIKQLESWIEKL